MDKKIAYCGLNCEKCETYIATINNNNELRKTVASKWSKYNNIEIKPEDINCLGCKNDGIKTVFCDHLCEIRKCCIQEKYSHCGQCKALDNCKKIKMIISNNKEAYELLKKEK